MKKNENFNHTQKCQVAPFIQIKQLYLLTFLCLVLSSCQKEEKETNHELKTFPLSESITNNENEGLMEFAPATTNPYTTQNMLAALNELKLSDEINCDINKFNIRVTHKYIRFEPQDSLENNTLKADTTLILFDYPLDRIITKGGTYYKDPSLSENEFNFQWCSVPANKSLPINVHYTVLAELYLPEEDTELVQYYETEFDDCITKLVEYALKRTDNFDTSTFEENMTQGSKRKLPAKWTPRGDIKMVDEINGNVAIKGCKVRVHRFFEVREQLTDINGNFNIGHQFRYPVNYSIKWERNDFEIRHKWSGQAYFNGPYSNKSWSILITSDYSRMYAIIHRASHRYYYEGESARSGLRLPPGRHTTGRMTIGAFAWNEANSNGDCAFWRSRTVGLPEIRIFRPNRRAIDLFSTTIHELSHASHWKMSSNRFDYAYCDDKVAESWARGVQWSITSLEYSNYFGGATILPDYTQIVLDMIDPNYSNSFNNQNNGIWNDNVSGYTIKEIEDALVGQRTWNNWRINITNKYNNATETNLEALFNAWN